ncbi:MAG: hypothetical protein IE886_08185 [Campylobacterales bacterium]|nr:hypothetical protein [Campylobacterales bacterium]
MAVDFVGQHVDVGFHLAEDTLLCNPDDFQDLAPAYMRIERRIRKGDDIVVFGRDLFFVQIERRDLRTGDIFDVILVEFFEGGVEPLGF